MRRSSYDYPAKHQSGSADYYSHVNRMARAPSVLTDVPHYGHALFNNNNNNNKKPAQLNGACYQDNAEPVRTVVQVTETVAQCDMNGNCMVVEERVDVEADDYIKQKHKGFELFKWRTFKPC